LTLLTVMRMIPLIRDAYACDTISCLPYSCDNLIRDNCAGYNFTL
jgi:hypothetical protein